MRLSLYIGGELNMAKWEYTKGLHEVGNGLYAYLMPDGGWGWSNAGLIVDGDQTLLVDTLFDLPLTHDMLKVMRDAVPASERIGKLVNTHANADHTWGTQLVKEAEIIASKGCAEEFDHFLPETLLELMGQTKETGVLGEFLEYCFSAFDFNGIELTPPTTVFEDHLAVKVGDKAVDLYNVGPAHTRGDLLVHIPEDNLLYAGDILFVGGHPVIWDGPVDNWKKACDKILELNPDVVVPGHGPVSGQDEVRRFKAYLEELEHEVRKRYDAGLNAMEASKDIALANFEDWDDGQRVFANVVAIYREFEGKSPEEGMTPMEVFAGLAEFYDWRKSQGCSEHPHKH
jgi:cyclase